MKIEVTLCLAGIAAVYIGAAISSPVMASDVAVTGAFAFVLSYFMVELEQLTAPYLRQNHRPYRGSGVH
jgi:hypothetical protein